MVCPFLELACKAWAILEKYVVVMTAHCAQMVWLRHRVDVVNRCLCGGEYPILLEVATLHRFQGLQAQVILASPVSDIPGITTDIFCGNTLTSRAQCEHHLLG